MSPQHSGSRLADISRVFIISLLVVGCSNVNLSLNGEGIEGSGKSASASRKVESYHQIRLNLPALLTVDVIRDGKINITADDNILAHITTKVKDGELEISTDQSIQNIKELTITAQTGQLDKLAVNGSAKIIINSLTGDHFDVVSNGASTITVNGAIDKLTATVNGSGNLNAAKLAASIVTVKITGSGNVDVCAKTELNATTVGSGRIRYRGSAIVSQKVIGSGTIEKMP